jgi:hypothetical protein
MRVEQSKRTSSPDGMVALAIAAALLEELDAPRQKHLLSVAMGYIEEGAGTNRDEARRMLADMVKQYG